MKKNKIRAFSLVEISIVILIIGILTAAITKGSKIYKEVKLAGAQNVTKSSIVNSMNGLAAWWEPTLEESFLKIEKERDDQKISFWQDINPQISNKNILKQNNINYQPTYSPYALNNLPALKFNGSNYLEIPYKAEFNSPEFSIFVVIKPERISDHGTIVASRDYPPHSGYTIYLTPTSTYYIMQGNGVNAWSEASSSDTVATMNEMEILTYVRDSTTLTSYSKGELIGSNNSGFAKNNRRNLRVGAGATESSPRYFLIGYIGEIIIFDRALKDNQRSAVEKYLIQKWL